MPAAMDVTQEPAGDPRSVQEYSGLIVLALLAFAVGGTSGLVGAVFRLVLDRSDRFRGMVIDWAHGNQIAGVACVIGISAIRHRIGRLGRPEIRARSKRERHPGR
jgi:hypothetical protein